MSVSVFILSRGFSGRQQITIVRETIIDKTKNRSVVFTCWPSYHPFSFTGSVTWFICVWSVWVTAWLWFIFVPRLHQCAMTLLSIREDFGANQKFLGCTWGPEVSPCSLWSRRPLTWRGHDCDIPKDVPLLQCPKINIQGLVELKRRIICRIMVQFTPETVQEDVRFCVLSSPNTVRSPPPQKVDKSATSSSLSPLRSFTSPNLGQPYFEVLNNG